MVMVSVRVKVLVVVSVIVKFRTGHNWTGTHGKWYTMELYRINRASTHWDCYTMGLEFHGTAAHCDCDTLDLDTVGLGYSGTWEQRDREPGTTALARNGSGQYGTWTEWYWDTVGLGHYGTWTEWHWDTMGLGHYVTWTEWYWDTMGLGHYGTWTQSDWDIMGLGHIGIGTRLDWVRVRVGQVNPNPNIIRDTVGVVYNVTVLYRMNRTGTNRNWDTIILG